MGSETLLEIPHRKILKTNLSKIASKEVKIYVFENYFLKKEVVQQLPMLVAVLIYLMKYVLSVSFIPSPFKSLSVIDTTKVDFVSSRTSPVDVEIVNFFVSLL